jgi:hypothetical protein
MANTGGPTLSVTMAVYNGGPYLQSALDTLSSQTFRDFELIVVDDGSTDGTSEVLTAHASREPRMRVVRHVQNLGLVPARNRALRECRGDLIAVADADDLFKPDRFERQVTFLARNPDVGFCGTSVELIDGNGRPTGVYRPPQSDADIRFFSLLGGCFWNTTTMYRAALLAESGGYNPAFNNGAEDYDLWVRLMRVTRCANLPEIAACQRVHSSSVTAALTPTFRNQCTIAAGLLSDYLGRSLDLAQVTDALALYLYGWRTALSGEEAKRALELLSDVSHAAGQREAPERVATFRHNVAKALFQQAVVQLRVKRSIGVRLAREARRWDPGAISAVTLVGYAARLLVPRPALDMARAIRGKKDDRH